MATWKSVVITIRGLLQSGRLATSPWKRKTLAFLGLSLKQSSPLWIPNTWTSWGRDRTSRPRKPSFFEGLRLTWCFRRLPNGASVSTPAPLSLHGALRCSQVRRPTWGRHPNLMNFLFLRNGVNRKTKAVFEHVDPKKVSGDLWFGRSNWVTFGELVANGLNHLLDSLQVIPGVWRCQWNPKIWPW